MDGANDDLTIPAVSVTENAECLSLKTGIVR